MTYGSPANNLRTLNQVKIFLKHAQSWDLTLSQTLQMKIYRRFKISLHVENTFIFNEIGRIPI